MNRPGRERGRRVGRILRRGVARAAGWLASPDPDFALSRRIFLRGLALVYAVAFLSFGVQAHGLVGSEGVLPASDLLEAAGERLGAAAFWRVPTLLWLDASDAAITGVWVVGVVASGALAIGFAPRALLGLLWLLYLSLASASQIFLSYQWDALLLEAGLLAIFLAPSGWRLRSRDDPGPSRAALWLERWLLFRLLFLSGAVKLVSGDPSWRDLTALTYHYWTQPLPTAWSPVFHELPLALHVASALGTFVLELAVPFLIFGRRTARLAAAAAIVLFQLAINISGNYGFFGFLTVVLCVLLIDDAVFHRPGRPGTGAAPSAPGPSRARIGMTAVLFTGAFLVTSAAALARLAPRHPFTGALRPVLAATAPLRSFNAYGLFAVMTRDRPEILLEGSRDGVRWETYDFPFKPDRPEQPPRFVPFHMPRLDWQMWFAALSSCARSPWVLSLQRRLLEGAGPVRALFADVPFPEDVPRYVRARLFRYRFAPASERAEGRWWRREALGPYCPVLTLRDGELVRARLDG